MCHRVTRDGRICIMLTSGACSGPQNPRDRHARPAAGDTTWCQHRRACVTPIRHSGESTSLVPSCNPLIRQDRESPTADQQRGAGRDVSARRRRIGSICGIERACRSRGLARRERKAESFGMPEGCQTPKNSRGGLRIRGKRISLAGWMLGDSEYTFTAKRCMGGWSIGERLTACTHTRPKGGCLASCTHTRPKGGCLASPAERWVSGFPTRPKGGCLASPAERWVSGFPTRPKGGCLASCTHTRPKGGCLASPHGRKVGVWLPRPAERWVSGFPGRKVGVWLPRTGRKVGVWLPLIS